MNSDIYRVCNMNVHYFRYPYSYFLEKQLELGVNEIVLWGSVPHIWIDQYGIESVNVVEQTRLAGIQIAAFAVRPYNYTLFADNKSLLQNYSMKYYKNAIDFAAEKNISLVGIDLWGALRDVEQQKQYSSLVGNLSKLAEYAKEKRVMLCVGNVSHENSAQINSLPEVVRLISDINNLHVSLNYACMENQGEKITDWIDTFGDMLEIIYVPSAMDGKGCHVFSADVEEVLAKKDYTGIVAMRRDLECYRNDPFAVDSSKACIWNNHKFKS